MKHFGLLVILFVTQINSYRMPLPYGNGYPSPTDTFWSKPTKANGNSIMIFKCKFSEIFIFHQDAEESVEPKVEHIESEDLVNAMNEAFDAIDNLMGMHIYNTRPLMEGLESKLRKNAWSIKTFLGMTKADRKEIRKLMRHRLHKGKPPFTRNRL